MEFLQRYWQQGRQVWLGMSLGRRILFSVVAALSVAAVVGVGYWASQPDYRVLYSELSAEDAGAITAKLQTQGVSFRLAANGATIMVPVEQVQQLRLDLSVEGMPSKGGKGFELLDGNQRRVASGYLEAAPLGRVSSPRPGGVGPRAPTPWSNRSWAGTCKPQVARKLDERGQMPAALARRGKVREAANSAFN